MIFKCISIQLFYFDGSMGICLCLMSVWTKWLMSMDSKATDQRFVSRQQQYYSVLGSKSNIEEFNFNSLRNQILGWSLTKGHYWILSFRRCWPGHRQAWWVRLIMASFSGHSYCRLLRNVPDNMCSAGTNVIVAICCRKKENIFLQTIGLKNSVESVGLCLNRLKNCWFGTVGFGVLILKCMFTRLWSVNHQILLFQYISNFTISNVPVTFCSSC